VFGPRHPYLAAALRKVHGDTVRLIGVDLLPATVPATHEHVLADLEQPLPFPASAIPPSRGCASRTTPSGGGSRRSAAGRHGSRCARSPGSGITRSSSLAVGRLARHLERQAAAGELLYSVND
jgi:hypothetical protein